NSLNPFGDTMNTSRIFALTVAVAAATGFTGITRADESAAHHQLAQAGAAPVAPPAADRAKREPRPRLFTPEEHNQFRERMKSAKTPQEREALRKEMRAAAAQRAKEKGVKLPERGQARGSRADSPVAKLLTPQEQT